MSGLKGKSYDPSLNDDENEFFSDYSIPDEEESESAIPDLFGNNSGYLRPMNKFYNHQKKPIDPRLVSETINETVEQNVLIDSEKDDNGLWMPKRGRL